ncbi:MAG: alpha/beta fold hydrolase [Deltaproteobacteria bacterium]|nr:alpha/beta fold hydrolase [Deltaproteobacteria bacterium]
MTPTAETLTIDGAAVTVHRGGGGPPIVFLHDVLGPLWEGLPERLARSRTVVMPALVGFPGSTYREDLDTMEDLAFWMLALLEQRGLLGAVVVGEGFGGWLAAEVASRWPAAVGRLALLAPFGLRLAAAPPGGLFELRGDKLRPALFADPESELARRHSPDMPTSMEEIEWKLTADRAAARFAWRPYLHNPKLARRLARVASPTLVLWGAEDRLLSPAYADAWAAALPQARAEVLPAAGHAIGLEQPEAAAARIEAFLAT